MPPQSDSALAPVAVGAFAAGAAVALLGKRLLDSRRKAGKAAPDVLETSDDGSNEDLASVLRRAALDVAVLATGQAAERLQGDEAATSSS